jgi:hypothetical protein
MQKLIKTKIQANNLTHDDIKKLDYLGQDAKSCPICGESFVGKEIPKEYLHYYWNKTHYSKIIGIEIPHLYDGCIMWKCGDCGTYFRRF